MSVDQAIQPQMCALKWAHNRSTCTSIRKRRNASTRLMKSVRSTTSSVVPSYLWQLNVVEQLGVKVLHHVRILRIVYQVYVLTWPVQPLATISSVIVQLSSQALIKLNSTKEVRGCTGSLVVIARTARVFVIKSPPSSIPPVVRPNRVPAPTLV